MDPNCSNDVGENEEKKYLKKKTYKTMKMLFRYISRYGCYK